MCSSIKSIIDDYPCLCSMKRINRYSVLVLRQNHKLTRNISLYVRYRLWILCIDIVYICICPFTIINNFIDINYTSRSIWIISISNNIKVLLNSSKCMNIVPIEFLSYLVLHVLSYF